jgi:hypothetical protein
MKFMIIKNQGDVRIGHNKNICVGDEKYKFFMHKNHVVKQLFPIFQQLLSQAYGDYWVIVYLNVWKILSHIAFFVDFQTKYHIMQC